MTQASRRRSPIQLCGVNQVTIIKFWRLLLPCAKVRGRVALRAKLRDAFHTELRAKLRDASWVWLNTASAVTFVAGRVVVGRLIVYCCPATMRTPRAQVTAGAVVLLVCGARRVILLIIPLRAFAFRGARCLLAAGLRSAPTTNVVSLQQTLYHYNERCITRRGRPGPETRSRKASGCADAKPPRSRAARQQGVHGHCHACMLACPPARAVTMLACPQEPRRRRQGGTPPARRKHRASAAQCRACASGAPSSAATGRAATPVAAKRPRHPPPSLPRSGATGQHRQQQPQQQNRYTHPVPESYAAGSDAARQPNPLRLCDWNRRVFATE
jgi:hypothetical protein